MNTNNIKHLLYRRTDLSTFLVHFTKETRKDGAISSAYDNLVSILTDDQFYDSCLIAGERRGMALGDKCKPYDVPNQQVVCFTETPLEQAWTLLGDIKGRDVRLEPYGVVFTKIWARKKRVNPVWYIDETPGNDGYKWLSKTINEMVKHDIECEQFDGILRLTPFFEPMGTWLTNSPPSRKEFWWEREWRAVGDLHFNWSDLVAVLLPEEKHNDIKDELQKAEYNPKKLQLLNFLDPSWGLERMISALANISAENAGPMPPWID